MFSLSVVRSEHRFRISTFGYHEIGQLRENSLTPLHKTKSGGQNLRTRNNKILLRLSDKELAKVNKIVEMLPYSRERYIREAILGADIYQTPPVEYGQIVKELRTISSNVCELLRIAMRTKYIDEMALYNLYNTVLDMDEKFSQAFTSKRYPKKMSELTKDIFPMRKEGDGEE